MAYDKITFSDFLHYFDFSFICNGDGTFSLIDLQYANLGNIENNNFQRDFKGIVQCIELLDTYIYDYTIRLLNENTEFHFDTLCQLLEFASKSNENESIVKYWCDTHILNAVCNPKYLILDFNKCSNERLYSI